MSSNIVGTCSLCGGPVEAAYEGERGVCQDCGAKEKRDYGKTIPMVPKPAEPPPPYVPIEPMPQPDSPYWPKWPTAPWKIPTAPGYAPWWGGTRVWF